MNEWNQVPLSDIIDILGGGTPRTSVSEYWDGDIPWLTVSDYNNQRKFVYEAERKITKLGLENSSTQILNRGDVIISARGTVGVVSMLGKPMAFNQTSYGIRAKSDLTTNDFVYYLLRNAVENLLRVSYGAVFDTITRKTFQQISIDLPPLPEQRAIAGVLSALDDKIDLLHRENVTLEALAETLFRQWFIEDAEDDWEEGVLSDFCDVIDCLHAKKPQEIETTEESSKYLLQVFNIAEGGKLDLSQKYFVSDEDYEEWIRRIELSGGDLIISKTGRVGAIAQIPYYIKTGIGRNLVAIHPKDPFTPEFLKDLMLSSWMTRKIRENTSDGTILKSLHVKSISTLPVIYPGKARITHYSEIINPIHRKVMENLRQSETLEKMRDTLLPKLMSGEIRLKL